MSATSVYFDGILESFSAADLRGEGAKRVIKISCFALALVLHLLVLQNWSSIAAPVDNFEKAPVSVSLTNISFLDSMHAETEKAKLPIKPAPIPVKRSTPVVPEVKRKKAKMPAAIAKVAPKPKATPIVATSQIPAKPLVTKEARQNYSALLANLLDSQKSYPRQALRRRIQGLAKLKITLDGKGKLQSVSLLDTSGSRGLDQEALDLVKRVSPFPAPPNSQPFTVVAPIAFEIE